MAKYKDITILGTSHIAKESVQNVKKEIKKVKPGIIALELDALRLKALLSEKKRKFSLNFRKLGFKGFLFNIIGAYIERSLSKHTGILPGSEMKEAIKIAKKEKIKIALIDQPINITIKKLMSRLTRKEKFTFVKDFFSSMFFRKRVIKFNLNTVPSEKIIEELMEETKEKYPSVFKTLVTERNHYMGKALNKLMHTFPKKKILAIVGAGHEKGIIGELKSMKK